ncbi:MAG: hypothetical protein NT121_10605 [Chloroflexi bacterium]|nr:hypothetical protein [Chloroflexota bacterium]
MTEKLTPKSQTQPSKGSSILKIVLQQRELTIFLSVLAFAALLAFNSPNFLKWLSA